MKLALVFLPALFLAFLLVQIYSFYLQGQEAAVEYRALRSELERTLDEQERFGSDLAYYLDPANLEKELRSRFNYKSAGETLLVIVPPTATTTP